MHAFLLMIDPVELGGGKRIFRDDGSLRPLRLVAGETTTTGAPNWWHDTSSEAD